jgi:hypothetical protein
MTITTDANSDRSRDLCSQCSGGSETHIAFSAPFGFTFSSPLRNLWYPRAGLGGDWTVVKLASSVDIDMGSSALSKVSGGDLTVTKLASSVDIDMGSSALSEVSGGMMSVVGMMSGCGVWS